MRYECFVSVLIEADSPAEAARFSEEAIQNIMSQIVTVIEPGTRARFPDDAKTYNCDGMEPKLIVSRFGHRPSQLLPCE